MRLGPGTGTALLRIAVRRTGYSHSPLARLWSVFIRNFHQSTPEGVSGHVAIPATGWLRLTLDWPEDAPWNGSFSSMKDFHFLRAISNLPLRL
jgi:hypothetical protein